MPLDRKPTKAAKPWVPDLLFEPVAPPQPPAAPTGNPAPDEKPVALAAATGAAVQEPAPQLAEPPPPQMPVIADSDDPAELRQILAGQEKALHKARTLRRNLQEDISKARRVFMFAERTRLYSAKAALDALIGQEQQSEIEERRLASGILTVRAKLDRLSR